MYEDRYEWLWVYAAVEPLTGESFFLFLPRVDSDCFELFLQEFRTWYDQEEIVLVLDNCSSHRSGKVAWPEGMSSLPLPAYSPELQPVEGVFKDLRGQLSNAVFDDVEALEQMLLAQIQRYWDDPQQLQRLTAFPWWLDALDNIQTSSC
jgi:transposase